MSPCPVVAFILTQNNRKYGENPHYVSRKLIQLSPFPVQLRRRHAGIRQRPRPSLYQDHQGAVHEAEGRGQVLVRKQGKQVSCGINDFDIQKSLWNIILFNFDVSFNYFYPTMLFFLYKNH